MGWSLCSVSTAYFAQPSSQLGSTLTRTKNLRSSRFGAWPGGIYLPLPEELEERVDLLGVTLVQGEERAAAAPAARAGGAVGGGHPLLVADMAAGRPWEPWRV